MKPIQKLVPSLALLTLVLAGCSEAPPPPQREQDRALERAVQEPLDRAREVEQQLRDARKQQDAEIRDGGG